MKQQRLSEWIKETIEIAEIRIKGHNGNYYHGVRDYLKEIIGAVESLEAASAPWQYIDLADAGTLPPFLGKLLVTSKDGTVEGGYRDRAMYRGREIDIIWHENGDWTNLEDCVAWQPWPEPAPLPGEVNE